MSLSDLKRRIGSIKNTSKITKAMSLISAAQMNKLKQVLIGYYSYAAAISEIVSTIAFKARKRFDIDSTELVIDNQLVVDICQQHLNLDSHHAPENRKLLIVVTGERGLCGSFNSSVVNKTLKIVDDNTDIMCIGKKGYEMLIKNRKKKVNIVGNNYIELHSKNISFQIVRDQITSHIIQLISSNIYSTVDIVYTEFMSMLKQDVEVKQLLPLKIDHHHSGEFAFDSSPMEMLDDIIPLYINSVVYFTILNSVKSETVKRMMTMDNANKNSKEMLHALTLKYNRARQTKVTMELIEVISGML